MDETFVATLGGARQVVNVRGADRANPILVFIHGGPASPEMPLAWSFQRPWEDFFTVVQWDQRASGRSYRLEDPATIAPTLSSERYRDDAIELIELLRKRYGQRKVYVLGLSYGSVIGLSVAIKRPDLLRAYIGVGQVIDGRDNERVGFEWTLAQAKANKNAAAVAALEALEPYPGDGPLSVARTMIERNWNIHYGGLVAYRPEADWYFHLGRLSPLYTTADRQAWDAGSELTMKMVWPALIDFSFKRIDRLDVPIYLFLGRHDYTTPAPIAADWLAHLHAPQKRAIWFEHSAHLSFVEEPGRMLQALLDVRSTYEPRSKN
ncbi:alpha/beta fold hydrolase [Sphingomonas sp. GB1N7]|uniref:alpha/beta fold hydrolase n=1 Tax=Parasphingomonas caseinilytica TaxID=3096158 RepID=UPI002FC8A93A